MTFQGKVALVAGGGRGIGAATAKLLAERGASVVVNYLKNSATASQVIAQIHENGGQIDAAGVVLENLRLIKKGSDGCDRAASFIRDAFPPRKAAAGPDGGIVMNER